MHAKHDSTPIRKLAIRFLQTPAGELRTAKFRCLAWESEMTKSVRRRRAARTRTRVNAHRVARFLVWRTRFRDGWHNNYPGLGHRMARRPQAPLWLLAFEVKPAWQDLTCGEKCYFLQRKHRFFAGPNLSVQHGFRPAPQEMADFPFVATLSRLQVHASDTVRQAKPAHVRSSPRPRRAEESQKWRASISLRTLSSSICFCSRTWDRCLMVGSRPSDHYACC